MVPDKEIWLKKVPEGTDLSTKTGWKYERGGQITQWDFFQEVKKNGGNYSHTQYDVSEPP